MKEKYSTDILIEGNGLSAASLAYYVSLTNSSDDITLLLNEAQQDQLSFLTPSILQPITELQSSLMAKAFSTTGLVLNEFHSITSQFELTKNPLALLFRTKKSKDMMNKIVAKLAETGIKHINYSAEDIATNYSYINKDKEIFLTEIADAYSCSDVHSLVSTYRTLAEENNVQIIDSSSTMSYIASENSITTKNYSYNARELVISTSPDLFPNNTFQQLNAIKVSTHIIEKFPRISIYDVDTQTSMWLEDAGYFHIFQLIHDLNQEEVSSEIKSIFGSIFPYFDKFETVDEMHTKIKTLELVSESIKNVSGSKMVQYLLPIQHEFSLAPMVSKNLSTVLSKPEKGYLTNLSLNQLINI